jgi:hypothetical protein
MTPFKKACQHNIFKLLLQLETDMWVFCCKKHIQNFENNFQGVILKFKLHTTFIIDVSICVIHLAQPFEVGSKISHLTINLHY